MVNNMISQKHPIRYIEQDNTFGPLNELKKITFKISKFYLCTRLQYLIDKKLYAPHGFQT